MITDRNTVGGNDPTDQIVLTERRELLATDRKGDRANDVLDTEQRGPMMTELDELSPRQLRTVDKA